MILKEDRAILSTFIEVMKSFEVNADAHPGLKSDPGATVTIAGINEIFYNAIYLRHPENEKNLIEELKSLQSDLGKPLTFWITAETQAPGLDTILKNHFLTPVSFLSTGSQVSQLQWLITV